MNINELVRRAKLGDNIAKERIILESKSFIKKVIKDTLPAFYYANCCYDDLYQEACIGVLSSVDTFDFDKKANFYTYSYLVVRGCLLKTLKENGRFIKIPGDMYWLLVKYVSVKRNMEIFLGREPSIDELSEKMNLNKKVIKRLEKYYDNVISIEIINLDRLNCNLYKDESDLINSVINASLSEKIDNIFDRLCLSDRDIKIIKLRYGFYDRVYGLKEIGDIFNISHQRVEEIINRIIEKIKLTNCAEELAEYTDNYEYYMNEIINYRNKNKNKRKVLLK